MPVEVPEAKPPRPSVSSHSRVKSGPAVEEFMQSGSMRTEVPYMEFPPRPTIRFEAHFAKCAKSSLLLCRRQSGELKPQTVETPDHHVNPVTAHNESPLFQLFQM